MHIPYNLFLDLFYPFKNIAHMLSTTNFFSGKYIFNYRDDSVSLKEKYFHFGTILAWE